MLIHQLINALNEIKQKYPMYDFNNFQLIIDDKDVAKLNLDLEKFAIKLSLVKEEVKASQENEE